MFQNVGRCRQACPLLSEEGWLRPKENFALASLAGADGVVTPTATFQNAFMKRFGSGHHPVCALQRMLRNNFLGA